MPEPEEGRDEKFVIATVDNECTQLLVYEGACLRLKRFEIDITIANPLDRAREKGEMNVLDMYEDYHESMLFLDDDDNIDDVRFMNDGQDLRIYVTQRGQPYLLDVNLEENAPSFEEAKRYSDKSIFKNKAKYSEYFESFDAFLEERQSDGDRLAFPETNMKYACVLKQDGDHPNKHFYIYDISLNRFSRKILKDDPNNEAVRSDSDEEELSGDQKKMTPEMRYSTDAFDIDPKAQILIYAYGRILKFQMINLPDSIKKHMAPQFRVSEHKYSPARI